MGRKNPLLGGVPARAGWVDPRFSPIDQSIFTSGAGRVRSLFISTKLE
jgi:hypothetical protein